MTQHAHTTNVRPHRAIRIAITAALIGAAAVATAPTASAAQAARPTVVTGTWTDAVPLTITGSTPLGAAVLVDAIGSSHWSGSLNGNTSFTLQALIAPDGSAVG